MTEGVLVGCDASQEWLLFWWWEKYCRHNHHPVACADFGMTDRAKTWCKAQKIDVFTPEAHCSIVKRGDLSEETARLWEELYDSSIWHARQVWFKKPWAMVNTPFEFCVWMDLDCEILGDISPVFKHARGSIGLVPEPEACQIRGRDCGLLLEGEVIYNSGLVAFTKGSSVIRLWAERCLKQSERFWGDQDVLSRIIFEKGCCVDLIDPIYNWRLSDGFNLNACVIHWVCSAGKRFIRERGGIGDDILLFRKQMQSI